MMIGIATESESRRQRENHLQNQLPSVHVDVRSVWRKRFAAAGTALLKVFVNIV